MAIRGGSIIHVGNQAVLLNRLQTAGPGTVNIKRTTVYELGNYLSVGQVSDIPDLSFSMDSLDASCAMEALLLDVPAATTHSFDLSKANVLNLKSAFKAGPNAADNFGTMGSAAIPCLHLESVSYKFGVGSTDATQTCVLKGDTLYYNPGSTYVEMTVGSAVANQTIATTKPAYAIIEGGVQRRTLAVTAGNIRLQLGADYTEAYGAVTASAAVTTITLLAAVPVTSKIYVTYSSPNEEVFPQSVHALVSGIFGTLNAGVAAAAPTISVNFATKAGDSLIIDDVTGSAVTEVVQVLSVAATTLAAPVITLGVAAGGGTFAAASYFWKLTAVNAAGETVGSNELTAALTLNQQQPINWTAIAGATGYKLYRGTVAGAENVLVATLGAVITYTDTGTVGTAATVPVANTTSVSPFVATLVTATVNAHLIAAPVAQYVPTVRPAALRGRDIDIYIGPAGAPGSPWATVLGTKRRGVQSATADWKVALTNDEEFGNYHYVNIDFDVPTVQGQVAFRPQVYAELLKLVQDLSATIDPLQSASPSNSPAMDLQIVLKNPVNGRILKRLHVPDARFSLPGYAARAQQKLDLTASYTSDTGAFIVTDY